MEDKEKIIMDSFNFAAAELPKFVEVLNRKDWVYYGEDNLWTQHLIDMYNYSSLHRTCINAKVDGVNGEELYTEDPLKESRLRLANSMESVYDVYQKAAMDYVLFGGFALNIIWKNDRSLGIAEIYHMDFSKLRAGKSDDFDVVNEYYYSADWENTRKYPPKVLPAFNINNEGASQVYYFKPYTPNQSYYPNASYLGSATAIQLDIEIKRFHLHNIQNSLNPSLFISMNNGIPSAEERESIFRHLENKYSGGNTAGSLFLSFAESKEHEPTITPISNNGNDNYYAALNESIQNSILTGHRISSPLLLGIQRPGALGGRQELLDSAEHFLNLVIKPIQNQLLSIFEKLLFIRDGEPIELAIKQNEIIEDKKVEA